MDPTSSEADSWGHRCSVVLPLLFSVGLIWLSRWATQDLTVCGLAAFAHGDCPPLGGQVLFSSFSLPPVAPRSSRLLRDLESASHCLTWAPMARTVPHVSQHGHQYRDHTWDAGRAFFSREGRGCRWSPCSPTPAITPGDSLFGCVSLDRRIPPDGSHATGDLGQDGFPPI